MSRLRQKRNIIGRCMLLCPHIVVVVVVVVAVVAVVVVVVAVFGGGTLL